MDIKRTVLLVVFSLSLMMLWENWNRYTGAPSLLSPSPPTEQAADAPKADASLPQAATTPAPAGTAQVPSAEPAAATASTSCSMPSRMA